MKKAMGSVMGNPSLTQRVIWLGRSLTHSGYLVESLAYAAGYLAWPLAYAFGL